MAIVCPNCEHTNPGHLDTCENCGELLPLPSGETLVLRSNTVPVPKKKKAWQSADIGESRTIKAHIDQDVLEIQLPPKEAITLGRAGEDSESNPDVDLVPYGAISLGVSRVHARLRFYDDLVQVQDVKSTNGTFLNEQRVSSVEWRIVRHGDELRLGHLTMKLIFGEEEW